MRANKFVQILSNSNHDGVTRGHLFRLLGSSLCKQSPPEDQHLAVLNGSWKAITTLTQASEFIHCIESWAEFVSVNFGVSVKSQRIDQHALFHVFCFFSNSQVKEIDTILSEVIVRMNQNRTFEKHYIELQSICNSIIGNVKDLEALLTTDNFLLFIDLFKKESIRMDVCKEILIAYKANVPVPAYEQESNISDVVVMNSLLQVAKHLNDGIT